MEEASFPNPLQIVFGEGRISVKTFKETDGQPGGVIFLDTKVRHEIGMLPEAREFEPARLPLKGEVYLKFLNKESLLVVRDALDEVLSDFEK